MGIGKWEMGHGPWAMGYRRWAIGNARWAAGNGLRLGLLVCIVLALTSGLAIAGQPPTTAAQEGFVPVTTVPVEEQLPAAPLVIGAYAVAWVAVVVYLWSIWQRLSRVERELAGVSRRIDSGAGR